MKKSIASSRELKAIRKFTDSLPEAEFLQIFRLASEWNDDIGSDGRYEGHFTVYLYMGNLRWDIKHEDFTGVRKAIGGDKPLFLVQSGFTHHNSMTFQYIMKSQIHTMFNVIKEILIKRLSK